MRTKWAIWLVHGLQYLGKAVQWLVAAALAALVIYAVVGEITADPRGVLLEVGKFLLLSLAFGAVAGIVFYISRSYDRQMKALKANEHESAE